MAKYSDFTPKIHLIEEHVHGPQFVRPDLAAAITVTAAGGAWTYGALSNDIIAAAGITDKFDIHWIDIKPNANDLYQLALVAGASTVIAEVSFERVAAAPVTFSFPVMTAIQAGSTQIRAKLASAGGGSTADIKVLVHTYP